MTQESSTGLHPRLAAALAYTGWAATGMLFWWVEQRDSYVRFHAAQSMLAFGLAATLIGICSGLAIVAVRAAPAAVPVLLGVAGFTWIAAVLLWVAAVWQAARGSLWQMPVIGRFATRLAAIGRVGR